MIVFLKRHTLKVIAAYGIMGGLTLALTAFAADSAFASTHEFFVGAMHAAFWIHAALGALMVWLVTRD